MFGFFRSGKKKDSPAPQQPQRIIEKGNIKLREDTPYTRGTHICGSFGTTDLDLVLERYAPEHSDVLKALPKGQVQLEVNQKMIYDKLKEQDKKIEEQGKLIKAQGEAITAMQEQLKLQNEWTNRLTGKLDFLSGAIGEIYEAVLEKQLTKESEKNTPQR